jgi:hypothetical protein
VDCEHVLWLKVGWRAITLVLLLLRCTSFIAKNQICKWPVRYPVQAAHEWAVGMQAAHAWKL